MRLFITIEAQDCTNTGLATILSQTIMELDFLTNRELNLEDIPNYGTEFREIAIIPSCMDDGFWNAFGWKERKQIWRQKKEADIRLRMDYDRFINETPYNKRLLFVDIIIKSIQEVQARAKGDFKGDMLIRDILSAMNISTEEIMSLRG